MFHQALANTEVKENIYIVKLMKLKIRYIFNSFPSTANRSQIYSKDFFRHSSLVITQISFVVLVQCNSASISQNKVGFIEFIRGAVLCMLGKRFHQGLNFWKRTALC